jgi:hypothetical protein
MKLSSKQFSAAVCSCLTRGFRYSLQHPVLTLHSLYEAVRCSLPDRPAFTSIEIATVAQFVHRKTSVTLDDRTFAVAAECTCKFPHSVHNDADRRRNKLYHVWPLTL